MEIVLKEYERIDELENGLKIIQNPNGFCFGTDAVLLANFVAAKPSERLLDLCTGTAIIPILLCSKTRCRNMTALEIQPQVADMAQRSVKMNDLTDKIKVAEGDLKNAVTTFGIHSFDVITCNPPYMLQNSGKTNSNDTTTISRHEIACTLEDVISQSARLLGSGGRFYLVHRTERLTDILYLMRKYQIEPKRMQLVHPAVHKEANLVLIEGQKDRNSGLKMMPPIYLYGG